MVNQLRRSQFMNDANIPFAMTRCFHDDHNMPTDHSHDFIELVYLVSGNADHVFEGEAYPIKAGDVFIINPGEVHTYRTLPGERIEIINCLFTPELIHESLLKELGVSQSMDYFYVHPFLDKRERFHHRLNLHSAAAGRVLQLMESIMAEWENRRSGYLTVIKLQMLQLLIVLSRYYGTSSNVKKRSPRVASEHSLLVRRITGFLERHFDKKLAITTLCEMFNISSRQLNRVFKQETGVTVTERIHQIRIDRAKQYLDEGDDKVIHVAQRVGYEDPAFFTQLFRRLVGCPPGQYRDRNG
ncbi:AraC family transcriptional regulator [Paenibacillus alginolyticus]|uniref:AraC family transcriptional regulator n=1 Tax=Paenibacillus alginolyticus TaxID=59839 RepID=A0ABT4GN70_9BACL|nr:MULTISPECIES: AraC family transcriptional regulator [Paenibacillus]MCY9669192.1 AraC family transcriptional regulator [Paenibacillus alginolyticus]MCY9697443.1 AraC family transcriptional regulator [Paenibacillus alginolyticus]MEC0148476.1 AraC family transcriptional regulator [Paenibacillus alginolyticus]NRF95376.1 helix-turn-helix transcriptional regulator [Paenibacillus frigoriresistens]